MILAFAQFHEHLNEQDPNIRFTTKEEQNNELPFLDVRVTRQDGRLRTGVHRKKTHTDRVLSFKSHHPISAKRSVIGFLLSRIDSHFGADDIEGREKERQHLFAVLQQNNYPRTFIERTVHRIECKKEWVEMEENKERQPVVVLPYVEGVSQQIAKVLSQVEIRSALKARPVAMEIM